MGKSILGVALVSGTMLLAVSPALAHDDDDYEEPGWQHIERDREAERAAAAKVEEEREELLEARRHQRRAWWNGDYWGAEAARRQAQHEQAELNTARRRLYEQHEDIERDRAYQDYDGGRRWWWGAE